MHVFQRAWAWFVATLRRQSNVFVRVVTILFVGVGLVLFLLPIALLYELVTRLGQDRLVPAARWGVAVLIFAVVVVLLNAFGDRAQIASASPSAAPSIRATPTPRPTRAPTPTPRPTRAPTPTPRPTRAPTPTPEPGYVSRATLGDAWPLTVEDGVLSCTTASGGEAVLFRSGGVLYTVNGWALTYYPDLPEIDPIWAAGTYAPKKDLSPLIELGLDLCN